MKNQYEVIRGVFSGPELEKILWDIAWIDWTERKDKLFQYGRKDLSIFDTSEVLQQTVRKLMSLLSPPNGNLTAWLERHKEGDWSKLNWEGPGVGLFLSLSQFRGGRTVVGDFKGYINPGEILKVPITKDEVLSVEKVSSGERVVLCLTQTVRSR